MTRILPHIARVDLRDHSRKPISQGTVGDLMEWLAPVCVSNYAEIVAVLRHLIVKAPDGCDFRDAASVRLSSIAMQGLQWAYPGLGGIVAVFGLG